MKKTILSLFILSTLGITSCSSDSDGETTDLTINIPTQIDYIPTENNDNYVKVGNGNDIVIGTLFDSSLSNEFSVTLSGENNNLVEVVNGQIKTKVNLNYTVGSKSVNYTVTQNGTSHTRTGTINFFVYIGTYDDLKVDVTFMLIDFNGDNSWTFASYNNNTRTLNNVPYQYIKDSSMLFQWVTDNVESFEYTNQPCGYRGSNYLFCKVYSHSLQPGEELNYYETKRNVSRKRVKVIRTSTANAYYPTTYPEIDFYFVKIGKGYDVDGNFVELVNTCEDLSSYNTDYDGDVNGGGNCSEYTNGSVTYDCIEI